MSKLSEIINDFHHSQKDCVINLFPNYISKDHSDYRSLKFDIIIPLDSELEIGYYSDLVHLQKEDILIICPHAVSVLQPIHSKCLIIHVPLSLLFTKPLEGYISSFAPMKFIQRDAKPVLHSEIMILLTEIIQEYNRSSAKMDLIIYSRIIQILECMIEQPQESEVTYIYNLTETKQKEYADKFMQICEYINEHYSSLITLEEVAGLAGFSKYHFSRLFKQFTGETFYQYLNNKRMTTAEILLQDPQLTITDVALHSGFPNISSFIRMFKLHNKCTPSEYRLASLKKA